MRSLRELLIGPPISSKRMGDERLSNFRALAALSPDALSSIAYANQEIFLGLVVAGAAGLAYSWYIALAIAVLLAVLALSYTQTIQAYPSGGGSYTVARENLGVNVGLVAAGALMTDYVLNVAVSVTAGVAAAASAFPGLWPHRTLLSLILLAIVTLANLRGLRESGTIMTVPVYFFLAMYLVLIAVGVVRAVVEGPGSFTVTAPLPTGAVTLFLILHTFSAGCTALTGVESISNGVPIFKSPESKHANQTMFAMAILMGVLFIGTTGLTQYFAVVAGPGETILSALTRRIWGSGVPYLLVQASTLLVLMVAANTSFVGFPRVASIVARDGYLPRQLTFLGDRLVYSNGILLLAGLAGMLVLVFEGDTHGLIPLFAIGAFLAFTLSQAGMVVHWLRQRGRNWQVKAALNGLGTLTTTTTVVIIGLSKFLDGAWIVILLIPLLVLGFHRIYRHYQQVAAELTLRGLPPSLRPLSQPRIVVPLASLHRGVIEALRYARAISNNVTAVYIEIEPGGGEKLRQQWQSWGLYQDARLEIVPSPYRSVVGPFMEFLDRTDAEHNDGQAATVLLPEFVLAKWWEALLHNQTAWIIKLALLYQRRAFDRTRVIIDVPFYLRE
ncbi:MAG: APC family permease [Chloroflexi bacterium]|nr:APC family permease [Chloroflexota bacterium]MBI5292138.1 APC family permease [Chloroflexota bacterium]